MTNSDDPEHRESALDESLRREFPSTANGLYLNHATIAPWPHRAAVAVRAFADENLHQGAAAYASWLQREQALRKQLAALTGATSPTSIALLKNTSEGISLVAFGLDLHDGDNIVLPVGEFPSNRLPWLAQAARGVELREIDIRAADDAEAALLDAVDARTRVLATSAVQYADGFRMDLQRLGEACRHQGVLFFVDAIQQLGALAIDVEACRIDFLAADAHKWLLGPEGIAVFYSREEARPGLRLLQQGWRMFDSPFDFQREDWTPTAGSKRFEAGSPNMLGQVALHASAGLLLEAGMERVEKRVLANTGHLLDGLGRMSGVRVVSRGEAKRRSGIVSFVHDRLPAREIYERMAAVGVVCATRGEVVRVSPHFYQGETDIEEFVRLLESIL